MLIVGTCKEGHRKCHPARLSTHTQNPCQRIGIEKKGGGLKNDMSKLSCNEAGVSPSLLISRYRSLFLYHHDHTHTQRMYEKHRNTIRASFVCIINITQMRISEMLSIHSHACIHFPEFQWMKDVALINCSSILRTLQSTQTIHCADVNIFRTFPLEADVV